MPQRKQKTYDIYSDAIPVVKDIYYGSDNNITLCSSIPPFNNGPFSQNEQNELFTTVIPLTTPTPPPFKKKHLTPKLTLVYFSTNSRMSFQKCLVIIQEIFHPSSIWKNVSSLWLRCFLVMTFSVFKEVFYEKNVSLFVPKKDRRNLCIGHDVDNVGD